MRIKHNVALILLVVAIGSVLFLCLTPRRQELKYQGRSIDYWFTQLPPTIVSSEVSMTAKSFTVLGQEYGNTVDSSMSLEAFDSFGIDAIPYLVTKFLGEDSVIEQSARDLARKAQIKSFPTRMAKIESCQAVTGLIHLKQLPAETVQMLTDLSKDPNLPHAPPAKYILERISMDQPVMSNGSIWLSQ
jgi:hypothetical protein